MRGYWKLWHDVRGRYLIACIVVAWQMFSTSGVVSSMSHLSVKDNAVAALLQARPSVCRPAYTGEPSAAAQLAQLMRMRETVKGNWGIVQANDYRLQAAYCAANERPTEGFGMRAERWTRTYVDAVWMGMMPLLMLFLGVMIAVGPPFSGESSESSTLTFSLPWSRARWLREKVLLSGALLATMILPVFIASHSLTSFPAETLSSSWRVHPVGITETFPSFLAGFVGIALAVGATMIVRNALAAALLAGMIAFGLSILDISQFFPSTRAMDVNFTLLNVAQPGGALCALVVIAGTIALSYVRLRHTDY